MLFFKPEEAAKVVQTVRNYGGSKGLRIRVQREIAPEKCLIRYEERHEHCEKKTKKLKT